MRRYKNTQNTTGKNTMNNKPFYQGAVLPEFQDEVIQDIDKVTQICSVCQEEKPLSEFPLNNTGNRKRYTILEENEEGILIESHRRYRSECNECRKVGNKKDSTAAKTLMKKMKKVRPPFGTPCECCGDTKQMLYFDHCHESDVFRGWLCNRCNSAIGMLGDDIEGIERALAYLKGEGKWKNTIPTLTE